MIIPFSFLFGHIRKTKTSNGKKNEKKWKKKTQVQIVIPNKKKVAIKIYEISNSKSFQ